MELDELIEHIVSTHHAYLQQELPRLVGLARKVADAHVCSLTEGELDGSLFAD